MEEQSKESKEALNYKLTLHNFEILKKEMEYAVEDDVMTSDERDDLIKMLKSLEGFKLSQLLHLITSIYTMMPIHLAKAMVDTTESVINNMLVAHFKDDSNDNLSSLNDLLDIFKN